MRMRGKVVSLPARGQRPLNDDQNQRHMFRHYPDDDYFNNLFPVSSSCFEFTPATTSSNCLPVPVPVVDDANDASDTVTSYHRTIVLFFTRGPQALGHGRPFLDITVQKHVGHHTPLSTAI